MNATRVLRTSSPQHWSLHKYEKWVLSKRRLAARSEALARLGRAGGTREMLCAFAKLPDQEKSAATVSAVLGLLASGPVSGLSGERRSEGAEVSRTKWPNASALSLAADGLVAEWRMLNSERIPDVRMLQALLRVHAHQSAVRPFFNTLRLILENYPTNRNLATYNLVIHACAYKQPTPHIRLMRKTFTSFLENTNQKPSVVLISRLCIGFARANLLDQLVETVETMEPLYGVKPTRVLYTIVMDAFGKAGRVEDMMVWFAKMRKSGVGIDHIAYNSAITAFGKVGDLYRMEELYHELMVGLRDETVADVAWDNHRELGLSVADASGTPQSLRNRELVVTYATLIEGFVKKGNLGRVAWVFQEMRKQGIPEDAVSLMNRNKYVD
ncbi:hypothetical protein HDU98_006623 [Podochytrium sp. JEL0797]|nr:hypothetical protein HDU98_006623 [Podochytrium sp. JEL0797]